MYIGRSVNVMSEKFYNAEYGPGGRMTKIGEAMLQAQVFPHSNFCECRDFPDGKHVCIVRAGNIYEALVRCCEMHGNKGVVGPQQV